MNVVIIADNQDLHAQYVSWGLKKMGACPVVWQTAGTESSSFSINISSNNMFIGNHKISSCDTVWFRRMFNKLQLHNNLHPDDIQFVKQETRLLFKSALSWLNQNLRFCANDYDAHYRIENKSFQLLLAAQSNLNVPSTFMTNQSEQARKFIGTKNSVVHKTAYPFYWSAESSQALASLINIDSIKDDFSIDSSPCILQQYIRKKADVRVFVLGKYVCAIKIASKADRELVDWRPLSLSESLEYSLIQLPTDVKNGLFKFMKKTQLIMGAFDFSVDKNDIWWFLEVNTQGQWLFMEEWIPEINLLGKFCSFLIEQNSEYDGHVIDDNVSSQNFKKTYFSKNVSKKINIYE